MGKVVQLRPSSKAETFKSAAEIYRALRTWAWNVWRLGEHGIKPAARQVAYLRALARAVNVDADSRAALEELDNLLAALDRYVEADRARQPARGKPAGAPLYAARQAAELAELLRVQRRVFQGYGVDRKRLGRRGWDGTKALVYSLEGDRNWGQTEIDRAAAALVLAGCVTAEDAGITSLFLVKHARKAKLNDGIAVLRKRIRTTITRLHT
jgi:hypothetical protein